MSSKFMVFIYATVLILTLSACGRPEKGDRGDAGVSKQGETGEKGDIGLPGSPGESIVGPPGASGVDATPVTIVKLCPGTTAYPGVYVEVALCLNNKLYGVYSANGGFLSEFPPGNYYSDGIGSACNLTVLANCVVQPL